MRWWRLALVVMAAALAAAAATVLAVAVNVATGGTARWFPTMERHPLRWTAATTTAIFVSAVAGWAAQRWYERGLKAQVPAVQRPERWVVDRPAEVDQIVSALRRRGGTVGITTAVQGAGGFGKTTVAKIVRADRRVLRRFRGRVYWVTLGRDVTRQGLAGLAGGLIGQLDPGRAVTFTDPRQAGEQLAAMLAAGPRRLVVLDDVWSDEHLAAFPVAGRCARLVTTRIPSLAGAASVPVRVDAMSQEQALALLTAGLPPVPAALTAGLVKETGRWPLLLRLVNKILADQAKSQPDVTAAARDLLGLLSRGEVLQVDQLTGAAGQQLDVSDPDQRHKAVRATIQASTSLLTPAEHDRFAELAIFAEDETIPVMLLAALWQATGGLDRMATRALCARLADLALVTLIPGAGGSITVHDVIRDFLRDYAGATRLAHMNRVMLKAVAANLPFAPAPAGGKGGQVTAWWDLADDARYLQEHLIEHMLGAGQFIQAEELATDLRWAGARLERMGPAGPYADLALIGTPRAERLRRVLGQSAHLLAPTSPPHSQIDILYSRVGHDPDWGTQVRSQAPGRKLPALVNNWPLSGLPDPPLRLTLHSESVSELAIAPDSTWLAIRGPGRVQIWDTATGLERATLTGTGPVYKLAIAQDSTWLATAEYATVRIWDTATGLERATLTGTGPMYELAFAPDSTWLATLRRGRVRIWDTATGLERATLTGAGPVHKLAFAPDSTWLATLGSGHSRMVQIWDTATGLERATLTAAAEVDRLAIAPDSTWLATLDGDAGRVQIWDTATGLERATLTGTGQIAALAIAPDSTWLATLDGDAGRVQIWDTATGLERATLTAAAEVDRLAIAPDSTWLATLDGDAGRVQIWDTATGLERATLTGTGQIAALAIAPDSTWLATTGGESVQIWDTATGLERATLTGAGPVYKLAIAPDSTWLAAVGYSGTVRIWDTATGLERATFTGAGPVAALAIAPDSTWLAVAGYSGTVRIWDTATAQPGTTASHRSIDTSQVAFAPDSTWLATLDRDGRMVRIWDTATGLERATLTGAGPVHKLAIAPDSTWLATLGSGHGRMVRIWDTATGLERATLTGTGPVYALAIAPDSTWLATAGGESVWIWDTATGLERATLTGAAKVARLAIAPDSTWLATADYFGTVRIWDTATGLERATLTAAGLVSELAIAPDSTWLATADYTTVRIWDMATGLERATLTGTGQIAALAIAPDSTWLATLDGDETVRIWDTATGLERATLTGTGQIAALAIAPDSTWLATAGGESVRIWDTATGRIGAVMRVDEPLKDCAWSPSGQMLAAAGGGLYCYTFKP